MMVKKEIFCSAPSNK